MAKATRIEKKSESKSIAGNRRKRRARRNPDSPPAAKRSFLADMGIFGELLIPGSGAYLATRILARIVYQLIQKRFPRLGSHAAVISSAGAFGAAWFLGGRVKALAPYHDAILAGSFIGATQTAVGQYMPAKYAWLVGDCKPTDVAPAKPAVTPAQAQQLAAEQAAAQSPSGVFDEYTKYEVEAESKLNRGGPSMVAPTRAQRQESTPAGPMEPPLSADDVDMSEIESMMNGASDDEDGLGIFSN